MAYRDPETGKFAKAPADYADEVERAHFDALRKAAPQDEAKMGQLVHGLEWDEEEPDADLLSGPTARQLWLFAIAAVILIVAVSALASPGQS
jgi:hypothetical protein